MKCFLNLITTLGMCLLVACSSSTKRSSIHNSYIEEISKPYEILFDSKNLSQINVSLRGLGYDGNQLASTMHSANMNASMNANYSPGAGLVGALIGGAIARESAISSAQKNKNTPVSPFLDNMQLVNWKGLITDISSLNSKWFINTEEFTSKQKITVIPELSLSTDYRAFKLISLVKVHSDMGKLIYQNYFHVHSLPLLKRNSTITQLNNSDMEYIEQVLTSSLTRLDQLIYDELNKWRLHTKKGVGTNIRFSYDKKHFYERGFLLKKENGYITYKNLRGEVKHMPFDC